MGVPITALMTVEKADGRPVVAESAVDLQGPGYLVSDG